MSTLFFDHFIKLEQLQSQIDQLESTDQELHELTVQIDQLIQQRVVEVILDLLHEDHHHAFIAHLHQNPGDVKILSWLKQHVEDIEDQIQQTIKVLEQELLEELFYPPE